MSTCNRLDLETLGSQPDYARNCPRILADNHTDDITTGVSSVDILQQQQGQQAPIQHRLKWCSPAASEPGRRNYLCRMPKEKVQRMGCPAHPCPEIQQRDALATPRLLPRPPRGSPPQKKPRFGSSSTTPTASWSYRPNSNTRHTEAQRQESTRCTLFSSHYCTNMDRVALTITNASWLCQCRTYWAQECHKYGVFSQECHEADNKSVGIM